MTDTSETRTDRDELLEAYVAGFMHSQEGWNGEHPFYGDREKARDSIEEYFEEWHDG